MESVDKKRILVVDDEIDQVRIVKKHLEAAGYEALTAHDGQEAIDKVRVLKPDLIVLDVIMSGINGFDVCALLGAEENYKNIPIIMLTAQRQAQDIKRGMEAGAISYVQKPFKVDLLLGIIKGVLG